MTVYPPAILDTLFSYQPPNDETRPRHAAVAQARADYDAALASVFDDLTEAEAPPPVSVDHVALHARVSAAARTYAGVINDMCGEQGDLWPNTARAVTAVMMSRMWANKAIRAPAGPTRGRCMAMARTTSEEAEMLANIVIALSEPVRVAYETLNG